MNILLICRKCFKDWRDSKKLYIRALNYSKVNEIRDSANVDRCIIWLHFTHYYSLKVRFFFKLLPYWEKYMSFLSTLTESGWNYIELLTCFIFLILDSYLLVAFLLFGNTRILFIFETDKQRNLIFVLCFSLSRYFSCIINYISRILNNYGKLLIQKRQRITTQTLTLRIWINLVYC